MMRVGVLCAVPGSAEGRLVAALDEPGTGLQVVRRCADLAEVVALALAGIGRVAVLDSGLPGADRASLARLRDAGCRVVILAEESDVARCVTLGAEAVLAGQTPIEDVVRAVRACVESHEPTPARLGERAPGLVAPVGDLAHPASPADTEGLEEQPADGEPGRLVAVWGPHGAPGRTTLAVNLAAELAEIGQRVVLVDADTWGGSVAQTLGLLDESAGIAAATRAAQNGVLDVVALSRLCPLVQPGVRVLTGLSRPDRWRELTTSGLEVVLETTRRLADWTLVDCGFSLEDEAGAGFEAMLGPRRNGATLVSLTSADAVLAVGSADPIGIQRLVQGLADLTERGVPRPGARRTVVLNKVRASAAGPSPERAVTEALVRYASVPDPVIVPDDRPSLDRALLAGQTLQVTAPASPARLAIRALALSLVDAPAETTESGRGRLWRARRRREMFAIG